LTQQTDVNKLIKRIVNKLGKSEIGAQKLGQGKEEKKKNKKKKKRNFRFSQ